MLTVLGLALLLAGLALLILRRLPPGQVLLTDRLGQGARPPQRGFAVVIPGLDQVRARLRTGPLVHQVTLPTSSDPEGRPGLTQVTLRYSITDPDAVVALGDDLQAVLDAVIATALAEPITPAEPTAPDEAKPTFAPPATHRQALATQLGAALDALGLTLVALDQVGTTHLTQDPAHQPAQDPARQLAPDAQSPSPRPRMLKPTLPAPKTNTPQPPGEAEAHPSVPGSS